MFNIDNNRHDWAGKMIHWELGKGFKFGHTNKWYIQNTESILENEMHKLLWHYKIQRDHQIFARRPDPVKINNNKKRNLLNCELCCPSWPQRKNWKKMKKRLSIWTLLGDWKNCETQWTQIIGEQGFVQPRKDRQRKKIVSEREFKQFSLLHKNWKKKRPRGNCQFILTVDVQGIVFFFSTLFFI